MAALFKYCDRVSAERHMSPFDVLYSAQPPVLSWRTALRYFSRHMSPTKKRMSRQRPHVRSTSGPGRFPETRGRTPTARRSEANLRRMVVCSRQAPDPLEKLIQSEASLSSRLDSTARISGHILFTAVNSLVITCAPATITRSEDGNRTHTTAAITMKQTKGTRG